MGYTLSVSTQRLQEPDIAYVDFWPPYLSNPSFFPAGIIRRIVSDGQGILSTALTEYLPVVVLKDVLHHFQNADTENGPDGLLG